MNRFKKFFDSFRWHPVGGKVPSTQPSYSLDALGRETSLPEGFIPPAEKNPKEEKHHGMQEA